MNPIDAASLAGRIDALLPQTQCTRCGYPTCRDYADAIARDEAGIDRCPPGGADGVVALAQLLGVAAKPIDPACGVEAPPIVAVIDEDTCIGCTKCIQACPVDAIVGAGKRMHTVIAAECTGCELCLPPCPVDCIALVPVAATPLSRAAVLERAARARARFEARKARKRPPTARASTLAAATRDDAAAPDIIPLPAPAADGTSRDATADRGGAAAADAAGRRPIDRAAVLAAIARGKARRAKDTQGP